MSMSGHFPDHLPSPHREHAAHLAEQVRSGSLTRRQVLVRGSVAGLSVGVLGSLLAACGSSAGAGVSGSGATGGAVPSGAAGPTGKPVKGGVLQLASGTPEADPDPVTMYTAEAINIVQQAAEYLTWVRNDGGLTPVLAESWSSTADAKTWTFQLKKGVVFSNGAALTSADVVATFNRLVDPASNSGALSNFQSTLGKGGIRAQGPYTVVFDLERAYADFPYLASILQSSSSVDLWFRLTGLMAGSRLLFSGCRGRDAATAGVYEAVAAGDVLVLLLSGPVGGLSSGRGSRRAGSMR